MSKSSHKPRKHRRVVSSESPQHREEAGQITPIETAAPATATEPIEEAETITAPTPAPQSGHRPARPAPAAAAPATRSGYRGVLLAIGVALIAVLALIIASGGSTPVAMPGQTPQAAQTASDAIFPGIDRSDVQQLMRRGKELYDQNRFEDAVTVYKEVIRLKPDNQAAHSNLGSTYFRLQKLDEALTSFREAVRLNPQDAEARQNLGAGLAATGSFDAAIAEYLQAVSLKPDLAPAHYSLGVLYNEQGNKEQAISELKRYLELGQDSQLRSDAQRRLQALGVN